ncbi:MAG: hypothetical protein A2147_05675, partial [Chloroflexi bacterium RBG_16_57_8]
FQAEDIGRIARPGNFFDFTRYRPTIYYDEEDHRQVAVPNTYVTFARRPGGNDLLLLHLLEPHSHSDFYIESVVRLLSHFGVKRYCLLGSMYDYVPHTMPLLVTGGAVGQLAAQELERLGIEGSKYEGPTTITTLVSQKAPQLGMDTMSLIVHLPQYTQLDDDYTGAARLMDMVASLYGLPTDSEYYEKAGRQLEEINEALNKNPQLKSIVKDMEAQYGEHPQRKAEERRPPLSREVERFLSEMERKFKDEGKG